VPSDNAGGGACGPELLNGPEANIELVVAQDRRTKQQGFPMADPTGSQHSNPQSDIDIARAANKRPILELAEDRLGIAPEHLVPYGHDKAKITLDFIESLKDRPDGKLILVTAITPTPAGEGKTTTTVGLGDGLNRIGKKTIMALREPSLGPCFGVKGGAAGGGYAQVVPMEEINLHFTGDFHAIGAANNLLAAMVDNHIYWGNEARIDPRRVSWRRVVDMNDRALRNVVSSLGGVANGFPREDGFDITVASEVMAIFCLSQSLDELRARLGNIVVGLTRGREPVRASAVSADGAMTTLLKDALAPNLVQTLENNPAFIHGGPFANIAHGCNTVIATKAALKLSDYVVTEAGFGADLGAEKFFDIKCRKAGLAPDCAVIVATIRALKMHGGVARDALGKENLEALSTGMENLARHVSNVSSYGVPVVVAINRFSADTEAERKLVADSCANLGVTAIECDHWAMGGAGCEDLAHEVVKTIDERPSSFQPLYPDDMKLWDKVKAIATKIYGADDITADAKIRKQFADLEAGGFGHYPVCMAKTQYSFSTDAALKNAPSGFDVPIREVRLSGGAEFVVVICGEIMTMPGLPRVPAANSIAVGEDGNIVGLF
jgi:formate--tetrahydrofolate ligase